MDDVRDFPCLTNPEAGADAGLRRDAPDLCKSGSLRIPGGVPRRLLTLGGRLLLWVLRWTRRVLTALILLSAGLVLIFRWVDPPASAFMVLHACNLWRLGHHAPYYHHTWVPSREISPAMQLAAIAGEDQRFPSHLGFDLIEIRHAWTTHQAGGRLRGASTISQQTAKNLFLWPGHGWKRKVIEAWFTLLIETLWTKRRILEVYLNVVQFSPTTYGVGAASMRYFGHPASEITAEEAALLIGVLPAPGLYRLDEPSQHLRRRAAWILDQSSRLGGVKYLNRL